MRGVIFANIVAEAWASLRGRRLQAMLSSFGIATGIAAVVLLVSIVSGMHHYMLETLGAVGGDVILVRASESRSVRDPHGFPVSLRLDDLSALTDQSPYYSAGSAENVGSGIVRTSRRSARDDFFRGVTERAFDVQNVRIGHGRAFLPSEYEAASRVAVLGADLAQDLFNQESPVGQRIVVGDWPFTVVGVLEWVGDPAAGAPAGPDRGMFVPFKTCADAFVGNERASTFRLKLKDPGLGDAAVADTKVRLMNAAKRRGETSGEFVVTNTVERAGQLNLVLNSIKMVVGLVGGIGLFVGAVGVANVLLVSVRERRSEIGVRRAIGATRRAIFVGFLLEALAITLSGGLVGIAVAWALTKIALFIPSVPVAARPQISLVTALTAVGLLALVGLVAGVGPARRAAAVYPSEALRAD